MNKQGEKGIEWTRIIQPDGNRLPGYTWNPTGGCLHGCTWQMPDGSVTQCYAKTIAEKFNAAFPQGFEAHYWREHELNAPLKLKAPAGIFVGSMADLFGHWVPSAQIQRVLDVMQQADWHTFQTLSKYPIRLAEFSPYPANVWVGVSLPAGHQMSESGAKRALKVYLGQMENIEASVRFMSIEPLWFDVAPVFEAWLQTHDNLPFEWAIIGAASDGRKLYQPKNAWVTDLHRLMDGQRIPVFHKGNLRGNPAVNPIREDFPTFISLDSTPAPVQLELF